MTFSRWNLMIMPNLDEEKPMSFSKRFNPLYTMERTKPEVTEEEARGAGGAPIGAAAILAALTAVASSLLKPGMARRNARTCARTFRQCAP